MTNPTNAPIHVNGYHAHVYYDISTRPIAERLAEAVSSKFSVKFGGFRDGPVGPHPVANLIHPLTDDSADDHSQYALWLGTPVPLRLETLRPSYRPELLPDN